MSWMHAMWVASAEKRVRVADHIGSDVVDRRVGDASLERQEMGIVVDFDGDTVLGPVICHRNLPASGTKTSIGFGCRCRPYQPLLDQKLTKYLTDSHRRR